MGLSFLIFIVSFFAFTCQIEGATYYVKTNGNDSNSGLSWANAWKTIQKAADTITDFDVVYISNGIYSEEIQVTNKNNVQFIGYGSNVMITGKGINQYGFRLVNCTNTRIVNFELCSNIYSMIYLTNSKRCVISNSIFHDNNPWYDNGSAIKLFKSYNCSIKNNLIYNIEGPEGWTHNCFGIALYYSDNNLIFSNEIKTSGSGSYAGGPDIIFHGIYLVNSDNNYIRYNHIHDMDHFGIHIIVDPNGHPYTDNKILDNIIHGMERAIVTENKPQFTKKGALEGQIIGRNKIFNTRIGIVWINNTFNTTPDGGGGELFKNSVSWGKNSDNGAYAIRTTCWAKISARYNTAYGYYDGIRFGNNGHIAYNNLTYSNYNKNVLNAGDNGGPWNQYVYYHCAESPSKVGPNIIYSTGSIYANPLVLNKSNTRLKWNSPAIGAAQPSGGIRGCIGAHTSYVRAADPTAGNITTYTMVFVTSPYDGAIPGNGKIQIQFPDGFSFKSPSVISHSFNGSLSISTFGSTAIFTRAGGTTFPANTPFRIVFSGVQNPTVSSSNYFCYITTMSNNNKIIEKEESNNFRVTSPPSPILKIQKEIANILLNQIASTAIPGVTIKYVIIYSNIGSSNVSNSIIYDKIDSSVTFKTAYLGTASGWTKEYSTNLNPDQSFSSPDYSTSLPSQKSNIKWIRWKKASVNPSEDGLSLFYEVIIK